MSATADLAAPAEIGADIDTLATPCVLVDIERLEANLSRFHRRLGAAGVALRPHAKTHKTIEIADRQLALGATGLTVAKPSEAEVFAAHGVDQIDVAFPVVDPAGARRLAELARGTRIAVHVDSQIGLHLLSRAATHAGSIIHVLVEIDGGLGRCGVPPDDLDVAAQLCGLVDALPGVALDGIAAFAGLATSSSRRLGPWAAGLREGELLTTVAGALRDRGIDIARVVAGSTATAAGAASTSGVTDVRAGAYVFMDAAQLEYGLASPDAIALTVLTTAVSRSSSGRVTFDAGAKTLSAAGPAIGDAYAVGLGEAIRLTRLYEEHGVADPSPDHAPVEIGTRVRLVPSYASSVVGSVDALVVVREKQVIDVWTVAARGCST